MKVRDIEQNQSKQFKQIMNATIQEGVLLHSLGGQGKKVVPQGIAIICNRNVDNNLK